MSQYPGVALSQLDELATLSAQDKFPVLDVDEPILAARLKNVSLETLGIFLRLLEITILKRRIVTASAPILSSDNLVVVRLAVAAPVTLTLPDGDETSSDPLLPQKLTVKDEGVTASVSNPITITPFSGQTIEGQSTLAITNPRGSVSIYYVPSDLDWKVIYG